MKQQQPQLLQNAIDSRFETKGYCETLSNVAREYFPQILKMINYFAVYRNTNCTIALASDVGCYI